LPDRRPAGGNMGTRSLRHRLPLFAGGIGFALAAADTLPAASQPPASFG